MNAAWYPILWGIFLLSLSARAGDTDDLGVCFSYLSNHVFALEKPHGTSSRSRITSETVNLNDGLSAPPNVERNRANLNQITQARIFSDQGFLHNTANLIRAGIKPFLKHEEVFVMSENDSRIRTLREGESPDDAEKDGKHPVKPDEYGSCVAIFDTSDTEFIGTGGRFSRDTVLTAFHVGAKLRTMRTSVKGLVRGGRTVSVGTKSAKITKILDYTVWTNAMPCKDFEGSDIAVLILDRDSVASLDASCARMDWVADLPTNFVVTAGYGITRDEFKNLRDNPNFKPDQRHRKLCWAAVSRPGEQPYSYCENYEFLAGDFSHRNLSSDSCNGDSGGPVFRLDTQGRLWLVGLVSRGVDKVKQSDPLLCGFGSVYTKVNGYGDWLRSIASTDR